MFSRPVKISKLLSVNDTGENSTHQAGILVPKDSTILGFFPDLGKSEKNPRTIIRIQDEGGSLWDFAFIYYNNKFFSERGTRNEYRLTGMTKFMRANNAHAGDTLVFSRNEDGDYFVRLEKPEQKVSAVNEPDGKKRIRLTVSSSWKVISI